jgi:hypothetical protein
MKKCSFLRLTFFLLVVLCATDSFLSAQQKVQVVTKIISHTFKGTSRLNPVIKAEKATVLVNSWDKNEIKVELRLIAKNIDRKQAEEDMGIQKYTMQESGTSILLSNYFNNNEFKNITSNLSACYKLWCPVNTNISITNLYGDIQVTAIDGSITVKSGFCQMLLESVKGSTVIESSYDNIVIRNTNSTLKITSDNSDIDLLKISGKGYINAKYGMISLEPEPDIQSLVIDAQRTHIKLESDNLGAFNLDARTQSETIRVPENYRKFISRSSGNTVFIHKQTKDKDDIRLSTTYCPIEINQK